MDAVYSYIHNQEKWKSEIMLLLQKLILQTIPAVEEKISYKVPFYYYHGRFCFIYSHKRGIDIGFCKGFKLSNTQGLLKCKATKYVRTITYLSIADVNSTLLSEILQEAALLNEIYSKRST